MQKSSYPPEIITVKVQNNAQPASKKSVFQRLGSKSKLAAADLSLEEQCKELRRQIKMEGGSSSAKKRATKRHKESSSSSEDSSSGSSSDSSSSSSSSQSSPTRRRPKKAVKKPHHHHSSASVDHLASKIRKTTASSSQPHRSHGSSAAKPSSSSASTSAATSKLIKKHKPSSRVVDSPPPPPLPSTSSSSRRRVGSASVSPSHSSSHRLQSSSSRKTASHLMETKKRDNLHRSSKETVVGHGKDRDRDRTTRDRDTEHHRMPLIHDARGRSRSPLRHMSRPATTTSRDTSSSSKRRLTPLDTVAKRHSSPTMRSGGTSRTLVTPRNRSVDRDRERREKDREDREIARNKEREEALMRCQERQRERERVARERERKERGGSREKSLDLGGKVRMHSSDSNRRHHEMSTSRTNAIIRGTGDFDRHNSDKLIEATSLAWDEGHGRSGRAGSSSGRSQHQQQINRERALSGGYEKEYVVRGRERERSPPPVYEEVIPGRSSSSSVDKYHHRDRSVGGGGGYEYEHVPGSRSTEGPGRGMGGYGSEMRSSGGMRTVTDGWSDHGEVEKVVMIMGKGREIGGGGGGSVVRERIMERGGGPKEWISGGGPGGPYRDVSGGGPKEQWVSPGSNNKWEGGGGRPGGPGGNMINRDEMWSREQQGGGGGPGGKEGGMMGGNSSWRNNNNFQEDSGPGSWQEGGGGGPGGPNNVIHQGGGGGGGGPHFGGYNSHHNPSQHNMNNNNNQGGHHQGGGGGPPQGSRMMGPRFGNDSWHAKPRFAGKKEFYPRHQGFQAGGGGHDAGGPGGPGGPEHNVRYPNHQQKRFGGEYQQNAFAPRGMMNQGPKFNAPMHGQHQQQQPHHQNPQLSTIHGPTNTPGGDHQNPSSTSAAVIKPASSVAIPSTPITSSSITTPTASVPVSNKEKETTKIEDIGTPTEDEKKTTTTVRETTGGDDPLAEEIADNLSEFSDDGDEILVKNDEELRLEREEELRIKQEEDEQQKQKPTLTEDGQNVEMTTNQVGDDDNLKVETDHQDLDGGAGNGDDQDDLTLDFEEISDGELEEESAKVKGLGDALGVDWAGLVAAVEPREMKASAEGGKGTGDPKMTTVKEMWEPKRIFKDVGISVRMAGRELAERLLGDLDPEVMRSVRVKMEPVDKDEKQKQQFNNGDKVKAEEALITPVAVANQAEQEDALEGERDQVKVDLMENPIASCQVALRKQMHWRSNLIVNRNARVGGTNPVALCARRDLQIRRQLCGLPAMEIQLMARGQGGGDELQLQQQNELKALALEGFAKATAQAH